MSKEANSVLYPKLSRFVPNQNLKDNALHRNSKFQLKDFQNLEDWFFYTHIDPVQRIIHAIGMFIGLFFFALCFYLFIVSLFVPALLSYVIGVFFYYVSGIISHQFYDAGTGRSHPRYLLPTFLPVIKINMATTMGTYDQQLREFVRKYPFVSQAYDLVEVPYLQRFNFLRGLGIRATTP